MGLHFCTLLSLSVGESYLYRVNAQINKDHVDTRRDSPSQIIWEPITGSSKQKKSRKAWRKIPNTERGNHHEPKIVIWEILDSDDSRVISLPKNGSDTQLKSPSIFEEVESLRSTITLAPEDYQPLLNLSYTVPTASVLRADEWRLITSTLSPFKSRDGTGNQNYAIRLDFGLNNNLQLSGFYSEADDPLNADIKGFDIQPANFWEVYGVAARWRFKAYESLSLALNGSIECCTVGSGGSDSLKKNSGSKPSPNIFNDSGKRVETNNIVGSLSIPLTWKTSNQWQFTFIPGINFLPSSQGSGQGGKGKFYGISPYLGTGFLWHPTEQLGFAASIAQPIGGGTNSFDGDLKYSKVPVISGGLNWHLNPRIALQGQLTNGFGATPATALLTLPSDNRLGYNASFIFTADAPDTPQPPLTPRQNSLSIGGLTVNTALVPPDTVGVMKVSTDSKSNNDISYGFSISNIFQLDFYRNVTNNVPQDTDQARTYANDGATNWRGSGKAVLTSPLRGAPIWSALRISFGRNMDLINNTGQGYLFAETPLMGGKS